MNADRVVLPLRKKRRNRLPFGGVVGLTANRAAKEIGISVRMMSRAIACGDVRMITFGGGTYVPHVEIARLKKLFEQQEENP
jgi:hypothetical protein